MKTPVNGKTLREHWNYAWWKYALLVVLAVLGWNLIYTVTAYRPPEAKKVSIFSFVFGEQTAMEEYLSKVWPEELSDMEDVSCVYTVADETYGPMQLTTYLAAGEGDIFLLSKEYFQNFGKQGGFLELDAQEEIFAQCEALGLTLSRGYLINSETREKHLYGIPCSELPGMARFVYDPSDCYLCVAVNNGNDENVLKMLGILIRDTVQPVEPTPAQEEATQP